jgi:peroxiredoxin family protein/TusA-related sulfurtransferase/rhodanese-related sulfurtransferase
VRNNLTVFDLEELELAYAPPFGSAKDPINMAGFVASNVVRGDLDLWYAEDYPAAVEGTRIIDVRTSEEFGIWHLPGAENVPLDTLREACVDWDTSTPIRLYCAVGFRSYLAYRSLRQRGFTNLKTLSGGSTTFRAWHQLDDAAVPVQRAPMENYAETHSLFALAPTGIGASIDLDVTGLACPGPIMKLAEAANAADAGDEITIHVSDPGFAQDAPAWVKRNGHELVSIEPEGPGYVAVIRKGGAGTMASARPLGGATVTGPGKNSFVVFSGDMDKVLASFIIANGALAMGEQVSMFFTFWGLNALRREQPPKRQKKMMDRMFGMMMPSGANDLPLSTMNMAGMGPVMIKNVMKQHNVPTLPELIASAQAGGARLIGCTMTMDLLGIAQSDLLDGVELGGVATFLGEASESTTTLFI